jgi:hypothetical protein
LPEGTRKNRLNGWLLVQQFCASEGIDAKAFETKSNPVTLFADLRGDMKEKRISDHLRETARPAMQALLDVLGKDVKLTSNSWLNTLFNNASTKIKRGPKYFTIWKLNAILSRIVALFPPDNLPWQQLISITGAIFLILVPCGTIALIRIDPTEASIDEEDGSVTVVTKEKTDEGGSRSTLCIRRRPEQPLSPRYYFDLLNNRSKRLGYPTALFVSDAGKPYTRSDSIAKSMGRLMLESGINTAKYKPYSIRHAMINELINSGMDEKQVNAYTGHSYNYHTAFKWYYHLDPNWAGSKLIPVSTRAAALIAADGLDPEEE